MMILCRPAVSVKSRLVATGAYERLPVCCLLGCLGWAIGAGSVKWNEEESDRGGCGLGALAQEGFHQVRHDDSARLIEVQALSGQRKAVLSGYRLEVAA